MKPLYQKRSIECMRACVASILEVPYDHIPHVDPNALTQKEFFDAWKGIVSFHGYELLWITADLFTEEGAPLPRGFTIGLCRNKDGEEHAVVCLDGRMAFDPYLGGGALGVIHSYGLFVALNPKAIR